MEYYISDWIDLVLRWTHFVVGITWVGSSFYFNRVEHSLQPVKNYENSNISGELWSIHGGAIFHYEKYPHGPDNLPLKLHWSKWESLATWISGAALLAVVYWWGASTNLIDRQKFDMSEAVAVTISAGSIVLGWFIYDALCRFLRNDKTITIVFSLLLGATAFGLHQVFGGRAAYIHIGIIMATIMAANVWMVILPGQKAMLRAIRAGKAGEHNHDPGANAKIRNLHNNYLTLPVLFAMVSAHFPMTYGNPYGWAILIGISIAGVLVRHYFNTMHKGQAKPIFLAAGVTLMLAIAILIAPRNMSNNESGAVPKFSEVQHIVAERCAVCHAQHPSFTGFIEPPGGLTLTTPAEIETNASKILAQAVNTHVMPPGNLTQMTDEERKLLGLWIMAGEKRENTN